MEVSTSLQRLKSTDAVFQSKLLVSTSVSYSPFQLSVSRTFQLCFFAVLLVSFCALTEAGGASTSSSKWDKYIKRTDEAIGVYTRFDDSVVLLLSTVSNVF